MPDPDQPPEPSRAARRAQKTRQRLLDSALTVFSERGVDATAIEDITEHADVGKGTFYRHFTDKVAILTSLTEAAAKELSAAIREGTAHAASLSDALDRVLAAESAWLLRRPEAQRLLLQVQSLLAVRPHLLPGLNAPLQSLVSDVEAIVTPLLPPATDALAVRRLALAAVATPLGALAFQQATFGRDQTDMVEALRPMVVAALPQVLRCAV